MTSIDSSAVATLVERAHREIDEGLLPACQLAVAFEGDVVEFVSLGDADDQSRFVIFSATKPIVASVIWQLLAEGVLQLEDRVVEHIPEFGTNGKDVITVEQVLLHTAGFPLAPLGHPDWSTREGRLKRFSEWRLNWEPGTRYQYHPTSAHWVLAELIERIDGRDYRESVRARVLDPLGHERLELGVRPGRESDVKPVITVGEPATPEEFEALLGIPGIDTGEVTDEALESFRDPAVLGVGIPGGGAVSTAAELALFYQALLSNDAGLWDPKWLAIVTGDVRNHYPDPILGVPANRTIGLVVAGDDGRANARGFGSTGSPRAFGHNGAAGQIAWADPDSGLSFVYLTNGNDRNLLRQGRRGVGLSSRAALCAV